MPYSLEQTEAELATENILVLNCPMRSFRCLALQNGRIVGVDHDRFDNDAEVRTALIHEGGHFDSGAFYCPYSPYQLKAQAEYRADKAAVLKNIPYGELEACLRNGENVAEVAEHFCVTEQFIEKACEIYRALGYDFASE